MELSTRSLAMAVEKLREVLCPLLPGSRPKLPPLRVAIVEPPANVCFRPRLLHGTPPCRKIGREGHQHVSVFIRVGEWDHMMRGARVREEAVRLRVRHLRLWGGPFGKLPSVKVGGRHVFERAEVEDFVRRRIAHFDRLASEGRTLPPGVKRPKPEG